MLNSPKNFYAALPVKTVADHFTNESLTLYQLANSDQIGILKIQALLNIILVDLILFFEVGKSMGDGQVKQTIQLILEDYQHLKPEDFKLCFNRLKKGYYGKLYDRLDGQIILDCLAQYDNERAGEIESIRAKENREFKKQAAAPLLPASTENVDEVFTRNMTKLKETLNKSKLLRETGKVEVQPKIDPIAEMHKRWLTQFDAIWKRQGYPPNRMITRYGIIKNPFYSASGNEPKFIGRKLDISGYMEHKQYQYSLAIERAKNAQIAQ